MKITDTERYQLDQIYRKYHLDNVGCIGNARAYFASRAAWLKAQGCNIDRKQMWDSDAQRVEFMLRWQ